MRFNPPPNWPPAPPGWVPPAGWEPDPAWGPPPYGWQLWVEDRPTPTPQYQPMPQQMPMGERPLMTFKSHVAGKNADVTVYPNRVEWKRTDHLGTGGKVALGAMTMGLSLAATGVRGRNDQDMILMKAIQSVTSKNSGMQTLVSVTASGGVIEFRCSRAEADRFKQLLLAHSG